MANGGGGGSFLKIYWVRFYWYSCTKVELSTFDIPHLELTDCRVLAEKFRVQDSSDLSSDDARRRQRGGQRVEARPAGERVG